MPNSMQIGRVSQTTGLSVDAIRFYEKERLLDRPPRTSGGFRLFKADDIERIKFIRSVQNLGFSLPEIRELLVLQRDHRDVCCHVHDLLRAKIGAVREKILALRALERQLASGLRKCERSLESQKNCRPAACPVLQEAAGRKKPAEQK